MIVLLNVAVQPLLSVTVTVYNPATKFEISWVVAPFDHKYVYGEVPPLTLKSMLPVALPKHKTFTCVAVGVSGAAG